MLYLFVVVWKELVSLRMCRGDKMCLSQFQVPRHLIIIKSLFRRRFMQIREWRLLIGCFMMLLQEQFNSDPLTPYFCL